MIFRTPFFLPWLYPQLTWQIATTAREIYLTFDDGPIPGPTEFVLQQLERVQAKATFFCIGDNVKKHPAIFQRILAGGHAVGNHTFHHVKGWGMGTEAYLDEIRRCDEAIHDHRPAENQRRLFRPPYGRISRRQIRSLSDYSIIMWDVLTHDYSRSIQPDRCLSGAVRTTRNGSIVVFHDSLKAEKNLSFVLPRYLDHFSALGYTFKAISNP